jgi:pSer/pThr/pTyr-binding forkhead associated (FHA) protein
MELILEVVDGPSVGHQLVLQPGRTIRVGRAAAVELPVPFDGRMSVVHFVVAGKGDTWRVQDQNSKNGTLLNGKRVTEAVLREGDQITAGETTFVFRRQEPKVARVPAGSASAQTPTEPPQDLLQILRTTVEPLFALVDAARDPIRVLTWLQNCKEEHESLYEGPKGDELAAAAPYLVSLPKGSPFLASLVREGWGNSWGVYLTCTEPFKEVRKHFRHFLLVQTEDGKELYFRFYDPRVLRVFLPTCTPEETARFFGPVARYLLEGEAPDTLLAFTRNSQGLSSMAYSLLAAAAAPAGAR